ncbi:hypothetical protein LJC58_02460 [Lachnospiraceae bacterium OttesenSCG-928-D06]|nr:hypothetical protein [Lachnospiraceae bacterium OttesenSCG-928-D06]
MKSMIHPKDKYKMNWVMGNKEWGTVVCPPCLTCEKSSFWEEDCLKEKYCFLNNTTERVEVSCGEIAIYAPFSDDYEDSEVCLTNRCHAHVWCGLNVSYILGLRMGGESPHMGLSLLKGSLSSYSIEKDENTGANARGDIMLHPTGFSLEPGERYELEWVLFWHEGEWDFYRKLKEFGKYIEIKADRFVFEVNQMVHINIHPSFSFEKESVLVKRNGIPIKVDISKRKVNISEYPQAPGSCEYEIEIGGISTVCRIFVQIPLRKLVKKRCRFITDYQQYFDTSSKLHGAYLIYDNESHKQHYDCEDTHNAGRERLGMGVLIASYLRYDRDEDMLDSLISYIRFVYRELYDEKTGEVFNDAGRNGSENLLNYPWMAQFFIELYLLFEEKKYIVDAYLVMKYFYEHGGITYYGLEAPTVDLIHYMEVMGMDQEIRSMMQYFYEQARYIVKKGIHYPKEESFGQSIVASAAKQLLKFYILQKEKHFLAVAEEHLKILSLFNGSQPDYRMYECAVRYSDGKCFGKYGIAGDTFPHCWNAVTGSAYENYGEIMGRRSLWKKAEVSYSVALSLFRPNGTAYSVNMLPQKVNGENCNGLDPWANNQDWALYHAWSFARNYKNRT